METTMGLEQNWSKSIFWNGFNRSKHPHKNVCIVFVHPKIYEERAVDTNFYKSYELKIVWVRDRWFVYWWNQFKGLFLLFHKCSSVDKKFCSSELNLNSVFIFIYEFATFGSSFKVLQVWRLIFKWDVNFKYFCLLACVNVYVPTYIDTNI